MGNSGAQFFGMKEAPTTTNEAVEYIVDQVCCSRHMMGVHRNLTDISTSRSIPPLGRRHLATLPPLKVVILRGEDKYRQGEWAYHGGLSL